MKKNSLGKLWRRWKNNIRIDLKEIGINTRNLGDSAQDRDNWRPFVNAAVNLRIPYAMELVLNPPDILVYPEKIGQPAQMCYNLFCKIP